MGILVSNLNGATPVVWKAEMDKCPPDCGGEEYDTIEYLPHCPKCEKKFISDQPNYCPNCGTKLWWYCSRPKIKEEEW